MLIFLCVPLFINSILFLKYVKESPKYLAKKKKFIEAKTILHEIATINKRPPFISKLEGEMDDFSSPLRKKKITSEKNKFELLSENYNFIDLLR